MKLLIPALVLALSTPILAQAQTPLRLWPGDAPGAKGQMPDDIPTLTPYLPAANASGAAFIICPGGGYSGLSMDHEGRAYAQWLNQNGVAGFVLKYRLGSRGYRHPSMLQDATRAIRLVRSRAAEWKVDAGRVGVMGSSAGGHLASTLLTHFDAGDAKSADPIERESSRPDLGVLCYAVITMGPNTHGGSRDNLLGPNPPPELVKLLSNEQQVTPQTPPCFIWHTVADPVVKVENSLDFASALRKNGVPFDLHLYQNGGHGLGLDDDTPPFRNALPWAGDLLFWLKQQNFLTPQPLQIIPTSQRVPQTWHYTTAQPTPNWAQPGFDDKAWQVGSGGFGTDAEPGLAARTAWNTSDIWLRREIVMPQGEHPNLKLWAFHDEDVDIFLNGTLAAHAPGFTTRYEPLEISAQARTQLKPAARVMMAVHCHQTTGGQGVDVGIVAE